MIAGLKLISYSNDDAEALVAWLSSDTWPYHGTPRPSADAVRERVSQGDFEGEDNRAFWICLEGERVGFVVLHEMGDPTPIFDLRLRSAWRGQGLGKDAVELLSQFLFTQTDKHRVEAHTRVDNIAMRKVLRASGWVKEAHYRRAWPDPEGGWRDAVTYACLREDWERGEATPVDWEEPF